MRQHLKNTILKQLRHLYARLLADLGETYKRSNVSQIKVLLGSMFSSGIAWSFDGTLSYSVSSIYRSIRTFSEKGVLSGDPTGSLFERSLAFWERLRKIYEEQE